MQLTTTYKATPWKLALAGLVATFLAGMAATITIAANRVAPVTDADYYQKGLHYGRTASGSQNPGLGWSMAASLADGELRVRVTDQAGAPVSGGELAFEPRGVASGNGNGNGNGNGDGHGNGHGAALALRETAPGIYSAPQPVRQGDLHGTLRFSKGEAAASRKLVLFN